MSRRSRVLVVVLGAALIASLAVGSVTPIGASGPARVHQQASGVLRIAAEQEPDCADWIASCAGASWGNWALGVHTLPKPLEIDDKGEYQPGPMLVDFPTLDPGPPMKVTYRIDPAAVWSDGEPITSTDFQYLWKQITTSKDIYDSTGYTSIESVDTTDPKTAVVTFKEPYAAWKDLFGGFYFLVPSHLLQGKNRNKAMKDGYAFSGGPWKLDGGKKGWKKGKSITLVPNESYWGDKPKISKVIFQFVTESAAELQAVKSGQVLAAYPQPQIGALDELDKNSNLKYVVSFGNVYEGLWLNSARFPLKSKAVRQAVMYATDRQAIVDQIVTPSVREGRVLESFIVPTFPQFYTPAFDIYGTKQDLAKVEELMTGDGWTKDGGVWTKNGKKAVLEIQTTAGNEARELTEQLWQSQLQQAGFQLKIKNPSADVLFGTNGPKGKFIVGLYAQVGTPDPGLCIIFCSKNIPTKKNGFVGQNWTRLVSQALDAPWAAADTELDDAARAQLVKQGQAATADDVVSIPLYQKPNIFVWDASKLSGPIADNATEGPFWNMNLWTLS